MPEESFKGSAPLKRSYDAEELPREKLTIHGRSSLTDEELIAIFLRTGLQGCNVLELAAMLKRNAGSLAALGRLEAAEIAALCKGIGPAKAATLAAVFELGHRAAREARSNMIVRGAQAVYDYFVDELRFEQQERVFVLLLSAKHELIRRVEVGRGTLTRVVVHARDVYREAVRHAASSVVMVHNHPSGYADPSPQDDALTQQIAEAGDVLKIKLIDHIIIGAAASPKDKPYYSYREQGKLPLKEASI